MLKSSNSDNIHFVKLDINEDVLSTITKYLVDNNIRSATLNAIGVIKDIEIGYYDLHAGKYLVKKIEEDMELLSLTGNVGILNGEIHPHIHVVLSGKDLNCIGGHLLKAKVGVTCELFINANKMDLERLYDDNIKLNLLTPLKAGVKKC